MNSTLVVLRKLLSATLAAVALAAGGSSSAGQEEPFPTRPITVIVPFGAGGTADVVARVLGEKASAQLGQPILIDNRSGGDGVIGAQAAARARPDGYTLLQVSTGHVILPSLRPDLPYDLQRDFVPVFGASTVPQAIAVSGKSQVRTLADLAAAANATSNGTDYSSGGTGSISHLTGAYLAQALKMPATHVPYRGLSAAVEAVLSSQVQFTVVNIPDVIQLVKSGSLRLLAVTSEQRLPQFPDVPTLAEQGFNNWTSSSWSAYVAPARTPPEIVERLRRAYVAAASDPEVVARLRKMGVSLPLMNGSELDAFMRGESVRWRRVVETNHIKLQN